MEEDWRLDFLEVGKEGLPPHERERREWLSNGPNAK